MRNGYVGWIRFQISGGAGWNKCKIESSTAGRNTLTMTKLPLQKEVPDVNSVDWFPGVAVVCVVVAFSRKTEISSASTFHATLKR